MTKKLLYIFVGVALTIGVLGLAGFVYAQVGDSTGANNPDEENQNLEWMAQRPHWDMWFGFEHDEGLLSEYIIDEMASVFDLSDEAVAAFVKVRETMDEIHDQYSIEEIREMMKEALTSAINAALDNGDITQDQADRLLGQVEKRTLSDFNKFSRRGERGGFPRGDFPYLQGNIIRQYLEAEFAEALGLTVEEFQALKADEGFNIAEYAQEQEMTQEELRDWLLEIHTNAINAALQDEAITQDQADTMLEQIKESPGRLPYMPNFEDRGPHR